MNRRAVRLTLALCVGAVVLLRQIHPLAVLGGAPALRASSATAVADAPVRTIRRGGLTLGACELVAPATAVPPAAAYCTTMTVAENRSLPGGRRIGLRVAVIPASAEHPAADAVTFLDGGPGGAATADYPLVAPAFAGLHHARDVLLIDQRGTGRSNPLTCPKDPDAAPSDRVSACARALADRTDPRAYTTVDATADLDEVRHRLGYPQLTLVGVSYGTRVAQVYARDYPRAVRAVVLDSPVPNALVLGSEHARNLDAVLTRRFADCTREPACAARFGDPAVTLNTLVQRLAKAPVDVTLPDPTTNATRTDHLTRDGLAMLTRLYAYSPLTLALLPLTLDEARAGRYAPLLGQLLQVQSDLSTRLEGGMELSVLCSEDVGLMHPDPADAATLLGTEFVTRATAACAQWPHAPMPEHFHDPLQGSVPTLILSGEFDPVTPPRYATDIAARLRAAKAVVLPGQGHAVMTAGCAPQVIERFVEHASVTGLDTACLGRERAAPFFLGYTGAAP